MSESARATLSNSERGNITRARILDVAVTIIAKRGGRGVSLAEVAAAAGVSKTGLLHHFNSKMDLLNAAIDLRDVVDNLPNIVHGATGLGVLDFFVESIRGWPARPELIGLLSSLISENLNAEDPLNARLVGRAQVVHLDIFTGLEAGKADGTIHADVRTDLVAFHIIAFLNGLETLWLLDPTIPLINIADDWRDGIAKEISR